MGRHKQVLYVGALVDLNYGEAENGSTAEEVVVQWLHTDHAMQSERKKE